MTDLTKVVQLLMDHAPRGEPMGRDRLAGFGVNEDDLDSLISAGWLRELSSDAFLLRGDKPTAEGAVMYLCQRVAGLHISGRAALDLHGIRYFVYARERIDLWGDTPWIFPAWAEEVLLLSYEHGALFDAGLDAQFGQSQLPHRYPGIPVSVPERAALEYLSTFDGTDNQKENAGALIGMLRNIRPALLQTLADHCLRRDVVCALKYLGTSEGFDWAETLACGR
jgi:hypothetical protein